MTKRIAVYPGTFDPITLGHIDVIERAAKMVDFLVVGVLNNNAKTPLFTPDERVKMIQDAVKNIPNVQVEAFGGLLLDFVKQKKATIVVRGVRTIADFEYEFTWAQINRTMEPEIDTIFLAPTTKYENVSSSAVREIAAFGGDIRQFVTPQVQKKVIEKYQSKNLQ
ncbi:MAG: pantetheine-phosphate adenylyltransferase [Lachnospiraceae bacterium]|nr:pantetheine-phosphate adenylyltransferase [Lachnospiraceae bacterium]